MCGICGFAPADPSSPVDQSLLDRMTEAVTHRGPDSVGSFFDPGIGLGVRRLAINDLQTGDQPISTPDASVTVVCNGEIYNFVELRQRLLDRGHQFRSASDVEVIVHLYEDHGLDCLAHLRGMFAFALWDRPRRRLMLARDRLGIKPLYYVLNPNSCAFGSELKAILPSLRGERHLDPLSLRDVFRFGFARGPATLLAGVRQVPPGCYLMYQDGRASLQRYWDLRFPLARAEEQRSEADWVEAFRARLAETLDIHLRSDVPIAGMLSSGIDSSSVVALMCARGQPPRATFSLGFEDAATDEVGRVPTLDRFPGYSLRNERVLCSAADFNRLPGVVWNLETVFTGGIGIPRSLLSEVIAREHKVVMSGEGADEALGGYAWYRLDRLLRPFSAVPLQLRRAMLLGPLLSRRFPWGSQLLVGPSALGPERYGRMVGPAGADSLDRLFSTELRQLLARLDPSDRDLAHPPDFECWHPFSQLQYYELKLRLPDYVLHQLDRTAMAYGLEARVPFLDHELVELCARMPVSLKLRGFNEKYVLRQAMRGVVPPEILRRRKHPLTAPVLAWLRGPLPDFATELLSPEALRRSGYFDSSVVAAMLRRRHAGDRLSAYHLFGVLSVQLWDSLFLGTGTP